MINEKTIVFLGNDTPDTRAMVNSLRTAGFSVVNCRDVDRARSILKLGQADVLIADIGIARTEVLDLITYSRQSFPQLKIVVMSDLESSFLKDQSISTGADLFVEKPVDMDEVVEFLSSNEATGSFSGVVEGVDIIEYLQFIMLNGKKLVLEVISNGSAYGEIFVRDGRVVHAKCGQLEGEDAVYLCTNFAGGKFLHRPWRDPEIVSIDKPGEFLLIEAVRKRDEERADHRTAEDE